MRTRRLTRILGASQANRELTRGDVDATVWLRLKAAKARGVVPSLWEFHVSMQDVSRLGLMTIGDLCQDSVADAMMREGLGEVQTAIICKRSGMLETGRFEVSCEHIDGRALTKRLAMARVSGAEVRGGEAPIVVCCSWDGRTVPVSENPTVGRDETCDIVLDSYGVSRRHGQIVCEGAGRMCYIDRSANGSFVDGVVVHHASVALRRGSRIYLTPKAYMDVDTVSDSIG